MSEIKSNTGIQKRTETSIELTPVESAAVQAAQGVRIKAMDKLDIATCITNSISRAYVTVGAKALKGEERDLMETLIMDNILRSFPNITLAEIEISINKGSLGDFKVKEDEVIFVSALSVHTWIKAYVNQIKKEAIHKQRQIEYREDKKKLLSKEEKLQVMNEFIQEDIIKPWKEFQSSGVYNIQDPVSVIWNKLEDLKVIPFSLKKRRRFYKQAEEEIRRERAGGSTLEAINENRSFIIRMDQGDSVIQTQVKIRARQKALKKYFEQLRKCNRDLEAIINSKL